MKYFKGGDSPLFLVELLELQSNDHRFDALLQRAFDAYRNGMLGDALLATEYICRSHRSQYVPALLRAKIVEAALPELVCKAWYKAWLIDPENGQLQDQMLNAWLVAGALETVVILGLAFFVERFKANNHHSLVNILRKANQHRFAGCWKNNVLIEGVVIDYLAPDFSSATALLCVSNEEEDFYFRVPANGTRFQITPPNLKDLWSISFASHNSQKKIGYEDMLLLNGSPLAFEKNQEKNLSGNIHSGFTKKLLESKLSNQVLNSASNKSRYEITEVSIVIPVYRDYLLVKRCIESVLKSLSSNITKAKIVIVDDNSPEKAISAWLQTLTINPNITVLKNRHNLGFIGSVNRGAKFNVESDVLMLNADTLVQGNWLDRLCDALYRSNDIASVVPWSNNSEITSLIKMGVATVIPSEKEFAIIDDTAATLHRNNILHDVEIPSSIGFAMLMRRSVINEIGFLDDVGLVRGYGEEVDWCMRARKASYRHVVATGVFVAHVGTTSFRFEKTLRVKQNKKIINQRYPDYELEYALFQRDDPLKEERLRLIEALEKKNINWIEKGKHLLNIEDSFDSKISFQSNSMFSMSLPTALPTSYMRIAIWDHRITRKYAEKILRLARHISTQNDIEIRLLIIGDVNEALWHTGIVDVIPRTRSSQDFLISDMALLGLANCVALLYFRDEKSPHQNSEYELTNSLNIPATVIDEEFDSLSWLVNFRQEQQLKNTENY